MTRRVAYYPGCSLHGTAKELDASFRAAAAAFDIHLDEIPGWECCGNTAAHSAHRLLAAALPATTSSGKVKSNLGLDTVVVPCAACFTASWSRCTSMKDEHGAPTWQRVVGRHVSPAASRSATSSTSTTTTLGSRRSNGERGSRSAASKSPPTTAACSPARPRSPLAEDPEYPMRMDECSRRSARARRLVVQDRLLRRLAGALRAVDRRQADAQDPRQRGRRRRRGGRLRLPALPGQPRQPPARYQEGRPELAGHADRLPEPVRRPRRGRERAGAGTQEGDGRRRGCDGLRVPELGLRLDPEIVEVWDLVLRLGYPLAASL